MFSNLVIIGSILLTVSQTFAATNVSSGHEIASLQHHVIQLEKTVLNLQSQIQTQQQKYEAVLSSVLARFTSTTDELTALRDEHNTTVMELSALKVKFEETENGRKQTVALDAAVQGPLSKVQQDSILKFNDVRINMNKAYDSTTGFFTAPREGLYLFFANVMCDNPKAKGFYVKVNRWNTTLSRGWTNDVYGVASTSVITYLKKDDRVWFSATPGFQIWGDLWSNVGGYLIAEN